MAVGPFGSRMKADLYVASGVRVIRGNNLNGAREPEGSYVYVSEETANSLASCCLKPGDLVFPHRGNIGEVGITPDDGHRYMLSTSLMKLSPNRERVDPLYLMYFFKSSIGRSALLMNTSQVGTPGIATPLKSLKGIQLPLPPLTQQHVIVSVLSLSTTASPSCAKPTPRSKPSPRRCSSRGSSISTPCAPRCKAAPPKAWTRPRRRCFRMGSRRRSWGRCRGGGKSKHWGRFAATSTEGYRPSTLKPTVCWYSIKNAFVISPLITARGAGTTPRSEKSMAEKLLLVMFW